jgi:hypothetical protein
MTAPRRRWSFSLRTVFLAVTLVCCWLGYRRYQKHQDALVWVAAISGDQTTVSIVERELNSAGIDCLCEGSMIYGVGVPRKDADRARKILRECLALGRTRVLSINTSDNPVPGF